MADYEKSTTQEINEAATNVKNAAKLARDIGRVAAGDATAVKDLMSNSLLQQIIVYTLLMTTIVGMVIGASVTGVLNYITTSWQENWDENWTDQAVVSNGDLLYLNTAGVLYTFDNTLIDVITGLFDSLTAEGIANAGDSDNHQIGDQTILNAGRNPEASDYETTMQAIMDNAMLNKALTDRLDMIKGRVLQRGLQIKQAVQQQYITGRSSDLAQIAKLIDKEMDEKVELEDGSIVLYAGFNEDLSTENLNFDISAFQLTDLQALKILAIFSIQYDCQLTEMDMWTLMDYCGWYDPTASLEDLDDIPDSIYEIAIQEQTFGSDMGTFQKNDPISLTAVEFPALQVPVWTGTCAPQWYYEELAQIQDHNEAYISAVQSGITTDTMTAWGIDEATNLATTYTLPGKKVTSSYTICAMDQSIYTYTYTYTLKSEDGTTIECRENFVAGEDMTFTDLAPGAKYTLERDLYVEIMYPNGTTLPKSKIGDTTIVDTFQMPQGNTVSSSDAIDIAQFNYLGSYQTFGIIDKLYYSAENNLSIERIDYDSTDNWTREEIEALGSDIYTYWEKYVWGAEKTTLFGNTVMRTDEGIHQFVYNDTIPEPETKTSHNGNNLVITTTIYYLSLYDEADELIGYLYANDESMTFTDLSPDTTYTVYLSRYVSTASYGAGGKLTTFVTDTKTSRKDSFTTYPDRSDATAYELYISVNLSFNARSVDEIAFDLLGIWPGNLLNTVQVVQTTEQGNVIGLAEESEGDQYYYCLSGGTMTLISNSGSIESSSVYQELKRAISETSNTLPLTTTKWVYEYGISTHPITNVSATPDSGWQTVNTDGDNIVFSIQPQTQYYVYARISVIKDTLQDDGTVTTETNKALFQIDKINRSNSSVENGQLYACDHLGNKNLQYTWEDAYTDRDGNTHVLTFTRQQGFQYEAYVDMVMALCEYLEIPYDDWDTAVQRAKELGLVQNQAPTEE